MQTAMERDNDYLRLYDNDTSMTRVGSDVSHDDDTDILTIRGVDRKRNLYVITRIAKKKWMCYFHYLKVWVV